MKEVKRDLGKINSGFGDEKVVGLICNMKTKYATLKCVFKDCKFEHWFKYERG